MIKKISSLLLAALLGACGITSPSPVTAQTSGPGPQPSPWIANGNALSPVNPNAGITIPSSVSGGNRGAGTINVQNGIFTPTFIVAGTTGLFGSTVQAYSGALPGNNIPYSVVTGPRVALQGLYDGSATDGYLTFNTVLGSGSTRTTPLFSGIPGGAIRFNMANSSFDLVTAGSGTNVTPVSVATISVAGTTFAGPITGTLIQSSGLRITDPQPTLTFAETSPMGTGTILMNSGALYFTVPNNTGQAFEIGTLSTNVAYATMSGRLIVTNILTAMNSVRFNGASGTEFWIDNPTTTTMRFSSGTSPGTGAVTLSSTGIMTATAVSSTVPFVLNDLNLFRETAGDATILALRNGSTAQQFRVYGDYTDASNYKRFTIGYNALFGTLGLSSNGAGSGTAQPIVLSVDTQSSYSFGATSATMTLPNVASNGPFTISQGWSSSDTYTLLKVLVNGSGASAQTESMLADFLIGISPVSVASIRKDGLITGSGLRVTGLSSGSTTLAAATTASGTLTLPAATDTLVGKATTDNLTNKTLIAPVLSGSITGTYTLAGTPTITAPTISSPVLSGTVTGTYSLGGTPTINVAVAVGGTWTAAATWTLPAHTLGGTVSGGGNQINNVIIGNTTPLAGSFTTLAASGAFTGAAISGTTGTFSGAVTGASYAGGAISGTTGTFSGAVTGASYAGGAISGTTGTFTSTVSIGGLTLVNSSGDLAVGTGAGGAVFSNYVTATEFASSGAVYADPASIHGFAGRGGFGSTGNGVFELRNSGGTVNGSLTMGALTATTGGFSGIVTVGATAAFSHSGRGYLKASADGAFNFVASNNTTPGSLTIGALTATTGGFSAGVTATTGGFSSAVSGSSFAANGCTIGSNGLCVAGTVAFSNTLTINKATGPQIALNGATSNYFTAGSAGFGPPTFSTSSVGTKFILFGGVGGSSADYAFGIDSNTLWNGVPTTSQQFQWYGGTTLAGTLTGAGALSVTTSLTATTFVNAAAASGYQLSGTSFVYDSGNYTIIGKNAGTVASVLLGNATDPTVYLNGGAITFRTAAYVNVATINSTGLNVTGTGVFSGNVTTSAASGNPTVSATVTASSGQALLGFINSQASQLGGYFFSGSSGSYAGLSAYTAGAYSSDIFRFTASALTLVQPVTASSTLTVTGLAVFNGTVQANAGLAVSGGNLTNTGVITTTKSSGALFQASSLTTNAGYVNIVNTGNNVVFGVEASVGGGIYTGSTAYAVLIGGSASAPVQFATSNIVRATIDSTGITSTVAVNAAAASGYQLGGQPILLGGSGYTNIYGSGGTPGASIAIGSSIDASIYLQGTTLVRSSDGLTTYTTTNSTGFGIGGSPAYKLDVQGGQDSAFYARIANGSTGNSATASMIYDLSGVSNGFATVGVLKNAGTPYLGITTGSGVGYIIANTANEIILQTGGTTRLLVYVGGAVVTGVLNVSAMANAATTSAVCYNTGTGALTYNGTAGTCTVSALRFKAPTGNAVTTPEALAAVSTLRTESWKYKRVKDDGLDDRERVGLYADDVEKMDKRCAVYANDNKTVNNYDDRCVITYLVAAMKGLKQDNDNLRNELKKSGALK